MKSKIAHIIATWFGSSLVFNKARGTWGTLAALPFAWLIQLYLGNASLLFAAIILFAVGTWASAEYIKTHGKEDPGEIVVDEVVGIWLLLYFVPMSWQAYALAFVAFRFFDVLKPWPVSLADKHIKGGFGVMFDDVLAALYPVGIYYVYMLVISS